MEVIPVTKTKSKHNLIDISFSFHFADLRLQFYDFPTFWYILLKSLFIYNKTAAI